MVGHLMVKDNTFKKTKHFSNHKNYSLKKDLLKLEKINQDFIDRIDFLTLEDLITLKLISSSDSLKGKLFNFPLLKFTTEICKEAIIRYALSVSNNRREACLILGIKKADLIYYLKKYEINLEKQDA